MLVKKKLCAEICAQEQYLHCYVCNRGVTVHITHGFDHGLRVMVLVRFGICYVQGGKGLLIYKNKEN